MKNSNQGRFSSGLQPFTIHIHSSGFTPSAPAHFSRQVEYLAGPYAPINLKEMESVSLQDRVDTKYILTTRNLLTSLAALLGDYRMLEIDGVRLNKYQTLYFDTANFALFHAHVNKRPERYKVRSREYTGSQLSFLEVKHHTRKDRTVKNRIRTQQPVLAFNHDMEDWLQSVAPLRASRLEAKLWNSFTRMTLVGKNHPERVTLDIDLAFSDNRSPLSLEGIVIAEVKRDSIAAPSRFMEQMRTLRIRPSGFSKYAVGIGLLYDQVKKNALKPKLRLVEKLAKGQV